MAGESAANYGPRPDLEKLFQAQVLAKAVRGFIGEPQTEMATPYSVTQSSVAGKQAQDVQRACSEVWLRSLRVIGSHGPFFETQRRRWVTYEAGSTPFRLRKTVW